MAKRVKYKLRKKPRTPQSTRLLSLCEALGLRKISKHCYKRIFPNTESVAAKEIFHPAILFIVSEVERNSVRPPVIPESLGGDKLPVSRWVKFYQPAIKTATRCSNANPGGPKINPGHLNPGSSQVQTVGHVATKLAREQVPRNRGMVLVSVMKTGQIETAERGENYRAGHSQPFHCLASGGFAPGSATSTTVSPFSSFSTTRNG